MSDSVAIQYNVPNFCGNGQTNAVSGFASAQTQDVIGAASPAITLVNNDKVGFSVFYEVA